MKVGTVEFEIDSTKVIETDTELVIPGKIARECVLPYSQGKAYRPKEELQKSLFTFDGAWIVSGKHPDQMLVSKPSEISGRLTNVTWDEKEALVSGEVHLFKDRNTPKFIQDVKDGKLKDVSIGFIYAEDWTPGEFKSEKYDFVQRDIVINHVAVGVPKGRCPSPLCGLTVDMSEIKIGADPWEETENSIRSGHGDVSKAETCRTKVINEGLSLVVCKNKETGNWFDQSFIFKKDQGWTMQKAKEWFSKHSTDSLELIQQLALEIILSEEVVENDSFGDASFPDSCFAYVPEEAKGEKGKKSLRKLPYKNKDGSINLRHVRNALSRLDGTDGISSTEKATIRTMLENILKKKSPDYQPSTDELVTKTKDLLGAHPVFIVTTK